MVWSATTFLLEVPSGAWADVVSRRLLLALSAAVNGVGYALWVAVPGYAGFLAGFVLWGLSSALASGTFEAFTYDELDAAGCGAPLPGGDRLGDVRGARRLHARDPGRSAAGPARRHRADRLGQRRGVRGAAAGRAEPPPGGAPPGRGRGATAALPRDAALRRHRGDPAPDGAPGGAAHRPALRLPGVRRVLRTGLRRAGCLDGRGGVVLRGDGGGAGRRERPGRPGRPVVGAPGGGC